MPITQPNGIRVSRRQLLKGAGAVIGVGALSGLAGCTGTSSSTSSANAGASGSAGGSVSGQTLAIGSNYSDAMPKAAFEKVVAEWQTKSGATGKINTVAHNDFQNNINSYLQGNPDQVFTWFSGYRMKYYAAQGMVANVDGIWDKISSNFSPAVAGACTAEDDHKYLIPWVTYPWAMFYRKSTFSEKGYSVPKTWDDFIALAKKMQSDNLIPIAFADSDGWPALGTFDYLNMRINGYQFHEDLLAHKQPWTSPKVKKVFDTWTQAMPYHQSGALGRKWEDAANAIGNKTAGMYMIGSDQIAAQLTGEQASDLDFFAFPEIDSAIGADAVEAPQDGFMLSLKGKDSAAAANFLSYLGTGAAQMTYLGTNVSDIASAKDADTSKYTELQKKCTSFIAEAKHTSQFFDRDTLPAFSTNVMIPALQKFVGAGSFDYAGVEAQAKQLFS